MRVWSAASIRGEAGENLQNPSAWGNESESESERDRGERGGVAEKKDARDGISKEEDRVRE